MLSDLEARWKKAAVFLLLLKLPVSERCLFFCLLFLNTSKVKTDS